MKHGADQTNFLPHPFRIRSQAALGHVGHAKALKQGQRPAPAFLIVQPVNAPVERQIGRSYVDKGPAVP